MSRARARRPSGLAADDRLHSTWPETWLTEHELRSLGLAERWDLAAERRRAALQAYARERRLHLSEVEARFMPVHRGSRAEALAASSRRPRHPDHEAIGALIRARRLARLVSEQ